MKDVHGSAGTTGRAGISNTAISKKNTGFNGPVASLQTLRVLPRGRSAASGRKEEGEGLEDDAKLWVSGKFDFVFLIVLI